ncbi:MAG: tRNA pseudouridine(55) synthase TruB [Actinomycetota bacterium]
MNGLLIVDKPAGKTSHDVVAICRRLLGERRIGHAGTLDPDATGVLVLGVGRATRLLQYLEAHDKTYRATAVFGVETTTQDSAGDVVARADASGITPRAVEAALEQFRGEIDQVPPMVSAVKVGGERLYRKARRGEDVERPARRVVVHEFELESFDPPAFRIRCSKGTYVRTLVHDLGAALGVGAHVATLRRTAVGPFVETDAVSLDAVGPASVRPMEDAVVGYPRRDVSSAEATALAQGKRIDGAGIEGLHAVVGPAGLVAVVREEAGSTRPVCVVTEPQQAGAAR